MVHSSKGSLIQELKYQTDFPNLAITKPIMIIKTRLTKHFLKLFGSDMNMSWGTEKTPEVQKMMGNRGDHVLCTTV